VCTSVILVVKELGFLNVRSRSVEALPMAQTVPLDEDQHYFDRVRNVEMRTNCLSGSVLVRV
jgi:hypothetical protein